MIRISVEVPVRDKYRLRPLTYLKNLFWENGIVVDWNLKNADLRIVDHYSAICEIGKTQGRPLETPLIVDESTDGARIGDTGAARAALAHPDVKVWLKRNTFRDFTLNNVPMVGDQYHTHVLNDLPEFHMEAAAGRCPMEITPQMAAKVRLLPTVSCDRFAFYRKQRIDWNAKRPIDVAFAGSVDYEVRDRDYWDGRLTSVQNSVKGGVSFIPELHRRAAVQQLARLRHLRVLIGLNGSLSQGLYETVMMETSISVSPWGLGEYAYRDYESVLAGCLLVKPLSDHVETFAPDIYQSGRYYIPCKPDFSDIPEIIEGIMSDRKGSIDLARQAREDMLNANTHELVCNYYMHLFRSALGEERFADLDMSPATDPIVTLSNGPELARAELREGPGGPGSPVSLCEDQSPATSHDLRLFSDSLITPGLYRLRFGLRARGRKRAAVQLHVDFKEQIWVHLDLQTREVLQVDERTEIFKLVHGPETFKPGEAWLFAVLVVRIDAMIEANFGVAVYPADDRGGVYYSGDGRVSMDLAQVELQRI